MHSNEENVETKLQRIAEKAISDPKCQFTSLFHLMNVELLMGCFEGLRNNAASGIDGVTKEQYAERLEENLQHLVDRLHRMSYIPQPVIRVNIPKQAAALAALGSDANTAYLIKYAYILMAWTAIFLGVLSNG